MTEREREIFIYMYQPKAEVLPVITKKVTMSSMM